MTDRNKPPIPTLQGRRVSLRPPSAPDYEWLYRVATDPETAMRWRFRGLVPSPELFVDSLWRDVEIQHVVCRRESAETVGLAQLMRVNMRDGTAHLSFALDKAYLRAGWPLEGLLLFVNYCFSTLPLRKIYFESLDLVVADFESAVGRFLQEEGRLVRHEFFDGQYYDLRILSLFRETWEENRKFFGNPPGSE